MKIIAIIAISNITVLLLKRQLIRCVCVCVFANSITLVRPSFHQQSFRISVLRAKTKHHLDKCINIVSKCDAMQYSSCIR